LNCTNPYTSGFYSLEITTNPIPDVPLLAYSTGLLECVNYNPTENLNWYLNNDNITQASNPTLNIFNGINYNNGWYKLSSTNDFGCIGWSDSIFIIQPLFNIDNDVICSSETVSIENITQNYQDYNCTVQWGDGQFSEGSTSSFSHQYQWGNEYSISMICSNQFNAGYLIDTLLVLDSPNQPQLLYSQPEIICTNCTADLSYDWNLGLDDIPDALTSQWNIWNGTNYTNGTYQLNIISNNGCTNSSDSITVIQPYFELDADSICQFDTASFQNLTDGLEWMTCEISWGDGTIETWDANPQDHPYSGEGNWEITLSCQDNDGASSGEMTQSLMVMTTPQPILTEINNIVSCENGNSQWITQWTIDNAQQPLFDNTLSLSADLGIEYHLIATTDFGCQGEASITTDYIAPSVAEIDSEILLYPNPTRDYIYLENVQPNSIISIYNKENKWMLTEKISQEKKMIDILQWPSGAYTMIIQNGSEIKTAQFLIVR
jgi:hypothetical protein